MKKGLKVFLKWKYWTSGKYWTSVFLLFGGLVYFFKINFFLVAPRINSIILYVLLFVAIALFEAACIVIWRGYEK